MGKRGPDASKAFYDHQEIYDVWRMRAGRWYDYEHARRQYFNCSKDLQTERLLHVFPDHPDVKRAKVFVLMALDRLWEAQNALVQHLVGDRVILTQEELSQVRRRAAEFAQFQDYRRTHIRGRMPARFRHTKLGG